MYIFYETLQWLLLLGKVMTKFFVTHNTTLGAALFDVYWKSVLVNYVSVF